MKEEKEVGVFKNKEKKSKSIGMKRGQKKKAKDESNEDE